MKFIKGVIVGSVACASIAMWYSDGMYMNKKRMMKKGKQFVRKMGIKM